MLHHLVKHRSNTRQLNFARKHKSAQRLSAARWIRAVCASMGAARPTREPAIVCQRPSFAQASPLASPMGRGFAEKMGTRQGLSRRAASLANRAAPGAIPSAAFRVRTRPAIKPCCLAVTASELPTTSLRAIDLPADAEAATGLPACPLARQPRLILDTQVVMEWLVFRDLGIRALVEPIEAGQWRWIGCPAMRDELLHVLSRGVAARWNPDLEAIAAVFTRLCQMQELPAHDTTVPLLKCRDRDDQKFIDLALAQQVDALISRDADVLALAKRARKQGLAILRPEQWLQQVQGATAQRTEA
ncbi:putative toxin-antitoxin system toxin component, PIN family [Roseateles sp. DB2]|uniref:putative toxin-antitoxin system toxin component, PIN family n=1 Tax=Roseateles sp. DB2 TaxID=3453717 RepID=UPI003EE9CD6F